MIRFRVDMGGWDKKLEGAPKRLRKLVYQRVKAKTAEIKNKAKKDAPVNDGKLARGIYGRSYENPLRASIGIASNVRGPTGYYYPAFVTGKETINIPRRSQNAFFAPGQSITYGFPALSASGALVNWKKDAAWWSNIEAFARRSYPQTVARAVKDFAREMNA